VANGPIQLVLYAAGEDSTAPGEEMYSSVEFTPSVEGWYSFNVEEAGLIVEEGEFFWVAVKWLQTGVTLIGIDQTDPYHGGGFVALDGETWQSIEEGLSSHYVGNPMLRAAFGRNIPNGTLGLTGWEVYRDGSLVQATDTTNLATQVPGLDVYEYHVEAVYEQGNIASEVITVDGGTLGVPELASQPRSFELAAVYPNPFNPTLTAVVSMPAAAELNVQVFNLLGQRVATLVEGQRPAGHHRIVFDGSALASGVYFLQAQVPGKLNEMRKVVLMK
jgi:hypothetical protein